jgi:hypothetical protein
MVSINLCNPCDQGRVDITIENMYFHAGNKLNLFRRCLASTSICLRNSRKSTSVGFGICMFVLKLLVSLVYKTSGLWTRRHGKTEVSSTNSASCSMHHVLRIGVVSYMEHTDLSLKRLRTCTHRLYLFY